MARLRKNKKFHIWAVELAVLLVLTLAVGLYFTHMGKGEEKEPKQQKDEKVLADLSLCQPGDILSLEQISEKDLSSYFTVEPITEEIRSRMIGNSYQENESVSIEELRYLKVLHYNFKHQVQVGEMVVNEAIAQDCVNIFLELFQEGYEIASMYLVDRYYYNKTGDALLDGEAADYNSVNNNNTSAFHYRLVDGTTVLSSHAYGLAIDINPLQNPSMALDEDGNIKNKYLDLQDYSDRTQAKEHMITKKDVCYETFVKYGFIWGGEWDGPADYQHFEKSVNR